MLAAHHRLTSSRPIAGAPNQLGHTLGRLKTDVETAEVETQTPAAWGKSAAHGGSAAYRRLRDKIQSGQPLVMLYNTGGVTQAFASIHRALQQGKTNSRDIVPALEVVSKENWAANFGIPEIMMMQELAQRAPLLLMFRLRVGLSRPEFLS